MFRGDNGSTIYDDHNNSPLRQLHDILRRAGIEINGFIIEDLLGDILENGTRGKAKPHREGSVITGGFNSIPSDIEGSCYQLLLVRCYDKDNIMHRFREMIYHSGIYCRNVNKVVLFVTTKWDPNDFEPHKNAVKTLKLDGVKFLFILVSDKRLVEIPV